MKINTHKGLLSFFAFTLGIILVMLEAILLVFAINSGFTVEIIMTMLISVGCYVCAVLVFYLLSYLDKCYVYINDTSMTYRAPGDAHPVTVSSSDIIALEYYRLLSIKSWLMALTTFVAPQALFLTYADGENAKTVLLGYITKKQLKQIESKYGFKIKYQ